MDLENLALLLLLAALYIARILWLPTPEESVDQIYPPPN